MPRDTVGPVARDVLKRFIEEVSQLIGDRAFGAVLFGSRARGDHTLSSDYDVVLFHSTDREKALDAAAEAAMRVSAELGVGIEPVVMSASEFWWGSSYFLERVRGEGFLIYPDGGSEVKRSEAVEMAMLAGRFIDAVKLLIRNKLYRSAVDEGYNATELAVKAMLLWDGLDLPSSHGGLVGEFGRAYVLTDKVERELGRKLGRALERRSRARYDARADITETDAKEVLELAEKLLKLAREKLRSR